MKGLFLILNKIMVGSTFIVATFICNINYIYGLIAYIIAYIILDLHTYFEKKFKAWCYYVV